MTTLKGRELDEAIAIQVMCWKRRGYYRSKKNDPYFDLWFDPKEPIEAVYTATVRDWKPSTDISAAFQVVEKMREEGFVVQLENGLDGTWECTFHKDIELLNTNVRSFYAPADTLPEAICLAALEAKGVGK